MIEKCLKWNLPNVISVTNIMILVSLYVLTSWINLIHNYMFQLLSIVGAISSSTGLVCNLHSKEKMG